jgi:hypothetical protein
MYLFARTGQLTSGGSIDWAKRIGAAAGEALGNPVALYARAFSKGFGRVSWTSLWPDLATLESRSGALMASGDYAALAAEGAGHLVGPIDDQLSMIVNGDPAGTDAPAYVWTVSAVAANGHIAGAVGGAVEIATFAESVTGRHVVVVANETGVFGSLGWVTGFESLAAFEADNAKLAADPGWFTMLDRLGENYAAAPAFSESALWVKL